MLYDGSKLQSLLLHYFKICLLFLDSYSSDSDITRDIDSDSDSYIGSDGDSDSDSDIQSVLVLHWCSYVVSLHEWWAGTGQETLSPTFTKDNT